MSYTVQPSDTWRSIAEATTGPGTEPAIIEANGGHPEHQLEPGSQIEIPGAPEMPTLFGEDEPV